MSIFQSVTLKWDNKEYVVPANQVMGLIAKIEDVITLAELMNKKGAPLARVAMGYGAALRYAGCRVKDEQVYQGMFSGDASEAIQTAVSGLLSMMIPPADILDTSAKKPLRKVAKNS